MKMLFSFNYMQTKIERHQHHYNIFECSKSINICNNYNSTKKKNWYTTSLHHTDKNTHFTSIIMINFVQYLLPSHLTVFGFITSIITYTSNQISPSSKVKDNILLKKKKTLFDHASYTLQ